LHDDSALKEDEIVMDLEDSHNYDTNSRYVCNDTFDSESSLSATSCHGGDRDRDDGITKLLPDADIKVSLASNFSGSPFQHSSCLLVDLMWGQRVWYIFRPSKGPGIGFNPQQPFSKWLKEVWGPMTRKDRSKEKAIIVSQRAGEVLYIPQGLYYAFLSVGSSGALVHHRRQIEEKGGAASLFYFHLNQGENAFRQKNYTKALNCSINALKYAHNSAQAHLLRARSLVGIGRIRSAVEAFEESVAVNALSPVVYETWATSLMQHKGKDKEKNENLQKQIWMVLSQAHENKLESRGLRILQKKNKWHPSMVKSLPSPGDEWSLSLSSIAQYFTRRVRSNPPKS